MDLTYTTSPVVDNVSIIFGWTKAYLWLKPSFTNYESFRIVASDGVHSTNSNLFTVYLNNNSGTGSGPAVDPGNDSLLVTSGNGSDSDSINGTVGSGERIQVIKVVLDFGSWLSRAPYYSS